MVFSTLTLSAKRWNSFSLSSPSPFESIWANQFLGPKECYFPTRCLDQTLPE